MAAEGVKFVTNTEVGENYPADEVERDFDAVVICTGATKGARSADSRTRAQGHSFRDGISSRQHQEPARLAAQRRQLHLREGQRCDRHRRWRYRHRLRRHLDAPRLQELDPTGNFAAPALDTRQTDNPWPEWPKVYKLDYGQEEAAARFGADPRVYLTTGEKFVGDEHGHVRELHIYEVEWTKNDQGAFIPKRVAGTEKVLPADLVLLAMGFLGPEDPVLVQLGIERDPRSNAKAEYGQFTTNVPGIFAAGDCRRGQSLVVWAINEGRGAARECDRFLMGGTQLP